MSIQDQWLLDQDLCFLNHGSFGATPIAVLHAQRKFQDALERDPIAYLAPERDLEPKLDEVRARLANLIGARVTDVAFVRNATDGVNAVLRSFPLAPGDEILVTDHGYNACTNAARFAADARGASVQVANVPWPIEHADQVTEAIERAIRPQTKLLLVDHVTSPTGLIFPLEAIVKVAHARGVRVLVDGAHAPGMIPLELHSLQPDYYTANHHKWLCAPKVSGFLWVHPDLQHEVRPTVISHAANRERPNRSKFLAEFDWTGTFDPSPLLALPAAVDFLNSLRPGGLGELMNDNHRKAIAGREILLKELGISSPAPESMLGSLAAIPITINPSNERDVVALQQRLRERHRIEVPVFPSINTASRILRISMHAYNDLDQIDYLAQAIRQELPQST